MRKDSGLAGLVILGWVLSGHALTCAASPVLPLPGGLADPSGRAGYVAAASGGIEAIDLLTGDVLWASTEADLPLLVHHDRLIAQAGTKRNRLRVLVYDLGHRGQVVLESDPVVFPDWVVTGEAPGCSFKADWRLERDCLVLAWQARAWYHDRTKPTPEIEAAARKQANGEVRIDLASGKVQMLAAEPTAVALGAQTLEKDLEKKAVRWRGVVAGQPKAVVLDQQADQQKTLLLAWDRATGKAALPRELLAGKRLSVLPSLDDRLICVRETATTPDQRGTAVERKKLAWALFSLESGELLARVPYEPSTQGMTIFGPRLFLLQSGPVVGPIDRPFTTTRILKALDLKTGRVLWQRGIAGRDVQPPAR